MFRHAASGSDLRLIDFGSSAFDGDSPHSESGPVAGSVDDLLQHATFAGSAFYISPEMFQKKYTSKTDVWSIGITLYVLVAGFPAEDLMTVFDLLQKSKRDLRKLPNVPKNMPDSYFDMLEDMLNHRHRRRKGAGEILKCSEFVKLHKEDRSQDVLNDDNDEPEGTEVRRESSTLNNVAANAPASFSANEKPLNLYRRKNTGSRPRLQRTQSKLIWGPVTPHALYLQYERFERSVTALLATVLDPDQLVRLLKTKELRALISSTKEVQRNSEDEGSSEEANTEMTAESDALFGGGGGVGKIGQGTENAGMTATTMTNERKLQIIKIRELKTILREMGAEEA